MKLGVECKRLADALHEKANSAQDPYFKAEYQYLVRGFRRLAAQFDQQDEINKNSEFQKSAEVNEMSALGHKRARG
jgi:hypothetical protein